MANCRTIARGSRLISYSVCGVPDKKTLTNPFPDPSCFGPPSSDEIVKEPGLRLACWFEFGSVYQLARDVVERRSSKLPSILLLWRTSLAGLDKNELNISPHMPTSILENPPKTQISPPARASSKWLKLLRRFAVISCCTWLMLGAYMLIDHCTLLTAATVKMPSWVPFWPSFAAAYIAMMFAWWLLPLAIRDDARFRGCVVALIIAYFLVMPWWVLTPTTLPRPSLPEGWWASYYEWLWQIDAPNNVWPCAHGIGPVVAAWFLGQDRATWRWPLGAMLLAGLPSIALTWQHRPIDILLGTLAAIAGIGIVELRRHRRLQNVELGKGGS
jgi:hypothetical protein